MLIIGAKGFAKEVLEICLETTENILFYDDINQDSKYLFEDYLILKNVNEAQKYFSFSDNRFVLGLGNPFLRKTLYEKFSGLGGNLTSTISRKANLGSYNINIGIGANILSGVNISNDVTIGLAAMIYYNSIITHDCRIGDFVEISPNVTILGRVKIGDNVQVGAGTVILPDLEIGSNSIIGAGSVVTKNVPENCVLYGVPAKIKSN